MLMDSSVPAMQGVEGYSQTLVTKKYVLGACHYFLKETLLLFFSFTVFSLGLHIFESNPLTLTIRTDL